MATSRKQQSFQSDEEEQQQQEAPETGPPQQRLDARPKNNVYADGTGPRTGRTAIRTGTVNRDGSTSELGHFGQATGPLTQPMPGLTPDAAPPVTRAQLQAGGGAEQGSGRLDTRPKNVLYAPGTGPGTGRTAIRVGTINRDGSRSALGHFGAATGPLSQPLPSLMKPRPAPASAFAQRQANVDAAKANGSFDRVRDKFNAANSGQVMDSNGTITKRTDAGQTQFASAPDGQGGNKMVPLPPAPAPAPAPATPAPATPAPATPTSAPKAPLAAAANAPGSKPWLNVNVPGMAAMSAPGAPKPPLAAAANAPSTAPVKAPPPPQASGKVVSRTISSQYGFGAANVTPHGAPPPSEPTLLKDTPSKGLINGRPSREVFGDLAKSQGVSNAFVKAPQAATPAPGMGQKPLPGSPPAAPKSPVPALNLGGGDKSKIQGRASGGPVRAGRPYLVGEEGPELIVPKESGVVVPNHALRFSRMDEAAGQGCDPVMRGKNEGAYDAGQHFAHADGATDRTDRRTSGLMMRPRPMPAAYARQKMCGGHAGRKRMQ